MKPEYRTRALDVAHAHLVWLTAHQLQRYELDINDPRETT